MNNVIFTNLPMNSSLHARHAPGDFLDCYCVDAVMSARSAAEIITDFPEWGRLLLRLRRVLTAPFGLSNDGPDAEDKVGIFPVESDSGNELIAGFNDKHLDFRVSVMSQDGKVYLATWVHTHNVGGRIYLSLIMPFHILVVRNGLRRVRAANQS